MFRNAIKMTNSTIYFLHVCYIVVALTIQNALEGEYLKYGTDLRRIIHGWVKIEWHEVRKVRYCEKVLFNFSHHIFVSKVPYRVLLRSEFSFRLIRPYMLVFPE